MRFRFIAEEAAQFSVSLLCRAMGVSRAGYYAWRTRGPSARDLADAELSERIGQIHDRTLGIYGAPRIHAELRLAHGICVGRKRVARLMRTMGIFGAHRRGGIRTTIREPTHRSAPDLVARRFVADRPDRLWVCDIKYVQTGQGFLFLAAVQDVFSRRIVGWSVDARRHDHHPDPGCLGDGARPPRSHPGPDRPFRPRQPVHEPGLWHLRQARRDRAVDGIARGSVGQRARRDVLRQPRERAAAP